ncbi:MAG: hypothetical protein GC161_18645 [Planctomycetaceae bacterium]|nr:hypothetical protein [Planctomycetaceae bacterium]
MVVALRGAARESAWVAQRSRSAASANSGGGGFVELRGTERDVQPTRAEIAARADRTVSVDLFADPDPIARFLAAWDRF